MKAANGRRERREAALRGVEQQYDEFKGILVELVRIPSVSASGFPPAEVRRSAEAFADLLRHVGLPNVQVLEIPGVHPYVYGEWLGRPGAPILLLYGHHDVVPPGRREQWSSPPFEPVERNGRLYGRGAADDKGGILVHVAAVAAYLRSSGSLPCNVKFLIEGEEEIGSGNLGRFLERYRGMMSAGAVVLPAHRRPDGPGRLARHPRSLPARVEDDGPAADAHPPPALRRPQVRPQRGPARRRAAGGGEGLLRVRADVDAAFTHGHRLRVAAHRGLLEPDRRIGPRPHLDAHGARHGLARGGRAPHPQAHEQSAPWRPGRSADRPQHALVGHGPRGPRLRGGPARLEGRIRRGAPCLLTGVEDPACGAHSENEGLHLGDWKKCMRAAVHLYDELSRPGTIDKGSHSWKR